MALRNAATASATDWPAAIHQRLKAWNIRQVAVVPDTGQKRLIALCAADETLRMVTLTTEEEGVALLAGAWLGGQRGVLLLQSSGVGNCINMLAMTLTCRLPLLMIVTVRGEWGEFNPWQLPMGQSTQQVLEHAGVIVQRADHAVDVRDVVYAAALLTFNSNRPVAVLLGQRLIGFKDWSK